MYTCTQVLFIASCLVSWSVSFGQTNKGLIQANTLLPQLDSMVIENDKLYINPKNIKEVYVLKDPDSLTKKQFKNAAGIVVFNKLPQLVPLNSLKLDKFNKSPLPPIYYIDGVLMTDTTGVKIDKLNIKKLEAINSDKNTMFNKWSIVYIITTGNKKAKAASNKVKRDLSGSYM